MLTVHRKEKGAEVEQMTDISSGCRILRTVDFGLTSCKNTESIMINGQE